MIHRIGPELSNNYRNADNVKVIVNQRLQDITNAYDDIDVFFDINDNDDPKTHKSKTKSPKDKISKVWKGITATNSILISTIKGTVYGALTGGAVLTTLWFKSLRKAMSSDLSSLTGIIKHPIKNLSKKNKIITVTSAGAVFLYHEIKAIRKIKKAANKK